MTASSSMKSSVNQHKFLEKAVSNAVSYAKTPDADKKKTFEKREK